MDRMRCIVDDRERGSALCEALYGHPAFEVTVARLAVGDYDVDGRFCFERKTLPDLIASIKSGRLFRQALRLAEVEGRQPALVLEGTARDLAGSAMRWEAVQGAMVTVSLFIGLPVLRTRGPEETLRTFAFAARQSRAVANEALVRRGRRPKGRTALQRHLLQGLPGVGPTRARKLLAHFGSVREVLVADERELAEIDGIGQETAKRIVWAANEPLGAYAVGRR